MKTFNLSLGICFEFLISPVVSSILRNIYALILRKLANIRLTDSIVDDLN